MLESDYETTKMNLFFASVAEETESELIDLFQLLLTDTDNLIETDTTRIGFPIEIDNDLFTEEVIHGIAFGILWEQQSKETPPQIVAPFGFYTLDEIVSEQQESQKTEIENFFWYIKQNPETWLEQKVSKDQIQTYCQLSQLKLRTLQASISFGILLESSDLKEIAIPKYMQEEIIQNKK